ncbi:MAG: DNA methyltransferase [Limisphaerales bacterium]
MLKEFDLPNLNLSIDPRKPVLASRGDLISELKGFEQFGSKTLVTESRSSDGATVIPTFVNEFWTAGQRAANNLHEVSYRACFKPQLPRFFIERLTEPGEVVYDPFMGRGTTLLEAALMGRTPYGNDINPLSLLLIKPRLGPPALEFIAQRLKEIPFQNDVEMREDLLVFYHPETLREICSLRAYLINRVADGSLDLLDEWIRMVAINRLTGHSPGFFSVYTLPPNQAVSIKSQLKINRDRNQTPPRRSVPTLILKKSRSLLKDLDAGAMTSGGSLLVNAPAAETHLIPSESVSLVVTSPPFLDVVDYAGDNWLRCWFAGMDAKSVRLTVPKKLEEWQAEMTRIFSELRRVLKVGGHVAFEVGEVRAGKVKLEETVITCGRDAGLAPQLVLINQQEFTKTANCWGVANNLKGTNSNRIVVFRKA